MENKKLGKLLIIIGIFLAIVPMIVLSSLAYFYRLLTSIANYLILILFIIGIIIGFYGEYLNRK